MARIRTIKPDFWTDPGVADCTMAARLLFIGSWNHADDYGVLKDDPDRLRLQVLPGDDIDAFGLVDELVKRNLLQRMIAPDGTNVLVIRTFCVHQKIDKRSVGRYGDPADFQPIPPDPAESLPIPPTPAPVKEGTGTEGNGISTPLSSDEQSTDLVLVANSVSPSATGPVQIVFDAWRESTGKAKAQFTAERQRVVVKALKTYPVDDLVDAVRGWRHSRHHRGENDAHTVYNDIELLLRNARNVEKFRDLERGATSETAAFTTPGSWDALRVLEGT